MFKAIFFMLFVLFASYPRVLIASNDELRIVGSVVDYITKLPVPGIYIAVKGMDKGAITNYKGKFVLRVQGNTEERNFVLKAVSKDGNETLSATAIPDVAVTVKNAGAEVKMYRYPIYYHNPIRIVAYYHKSSTDSQLINFLMNEGRIESDSLHGARRGAGASRMIQLKLIREKQFAAERKLQEEKDSLMKATLLSLKSNVKTVHTKVTKIYGPNYRFPNTEEFPRLFSERTRFPDSANKLHIEGAVVLQFQVDEHGVLSRFTFKSSPHPVFETELLRCAATLPKCLPARYQKRPTKTIVIQTVFFELVDI